MKIRLILAALLCAGLAACASGPAYRPAPQPGDYGYRDIMLTNDQFRVSFAGNYGTAQESVENFALYRAADVALANDSTRFLVVSSSTLPITENDYNGPVGNFGFGYGGYGGFGSPFYGGGLGYGGSGYGYSRTRFQTVMNIQIGPDVPADGPHVYNAEQLKHNLAAYVAVQGSKQ